MDRKSWIWYLQERHFLLFHLEDLCSQVLPGKVKEIFHTQHSSDLLTQQSIIKPKGAHDLPLTIRVDMVIKHAGSYSKL